MLKNLFKVHIFNPEDYPDKSSGGLNEILVNSDVESFIELNADTIQTNAAVIDIPRYKVLDILLEIVTYFIII